MADFYHIHITTSLRRTTGSKKATETQVDKSVDLRIDMVRFSTRRIHFWGHKRRNLAGSLTAIGPDRAYGPWNEHFGHFFRGFN